MAQFEKKEAQTHDKPLGKTVLELDDGKVVKAETSEFNGVKYFSVRTWIRLKDGQWTRTRNGLSVPSNKARRLARNLDELVNP